MAYVPGIKSDPVTPEANGTAENPIPASVLYQTTFHQHLVLGKVADIEGGTVIAVGSGTSAAIWITLPMNSGYNVGNAAALFANPEATSHIEAWSFDNKDPDIYDGFTALTKIDLEASGNITIKMGKLL